MHLCDGAGAGVFVHFPSALLLADDVGRVVVFKAGSLKLFDASINSATGAVDQERGWRVWGQDQGF